MNILIRITFYIVIFTGFLILLNFVKAKYPKASLPFLFFLFFYRIPFSIIYFNFIPGDWISYIARGERATDITQLFGLGTSGVATLTYPFVKIGLETIDIFYLYSFAGYIGVLLFYLIAHRLTNHSDKVKIWGINIFPWILLYPSLHMYTTMAGKDAIVLLGIALVGYSLIFYRLRKKYLLIGLALLLLVRPHIVFVLITSLIVSLLWSGEWGGMKKLILFLITIVVATVSLPLVLSFFRVGDVSLEAVQLAIQRNEGYVSTAGTYVDMTSYPFWLKAFTYLYRPLFFDSPNLLLLEYSAENLLFLFLTFSLVRVSFVYWINKQPRILKFCLVYFVIGTLVLSNGLSVFGLFIRQKTMVFLFLLILIFAFIHYRNQKKSYRIKAAVNQNHPSVHS
ncbi:hypothetical protein KUV50_00565 [Membranicola marinus]|uniref:Uncharacterized protein n=1 Tax=Membranihabitans marinus TaxID=1227546 RepID=A0A953HQM3_9BACT|nr:hypothetical protein [Membranihabitans marinus]MBY5956605.1 hypothetical protein [Membranihabitans marinus]